MKKVKAVLVMLVVLAIAFTAFGCAPKEDHSGDLPDDYAPEVSGKIRVNYYIAQGESDRRSVNDWISAFEKQYPDCDVKADFSSVGKEVIMSQLASGDIGDVFFLWETDVYNYAITQKALMALDSYVAAYSIDVQNVFNAILDMGVVEGKMYMVMRDYNHIAMMYNKGAIATANLTDPVELDKAGQWDWDTFRSYCNALTIDSDGDSKIDQIGATMRLGYAPVCIPFLEGWGGQWYDTVNKKVSFASDNNVLRGVEEMIDLVRSGTVRYAATQTTNGNKYPSNGINSTPDLDNYASLNVRTQIVFEETQFPSFASSGKAYDAAGIDWDVVSMPYFPTHKVGTGSTGFAVARTTKNPDAAAAFCLSLYTESGQRAYNGQEGGSVPNVRTLADDNFWRVPFDDVSVDPVNGKYYQAWISYPEADTYGQFECVLPPDIAEICKGYMQNVVPDDVNGKKGVSDTLAELEATANQKWEQLFS